MRATATMALWLLAMAGTAATAADEGVVWQPNLDTAMRLAAQTDRLVLIHFWGPNCRPCQRLEETVFPRPEFAAAVAAHYVAVKLNTDESPATARRYGITRIPTDVILTPTGGLVAQLGCPVGMPQYIAQLGGVVETRRQMLAQASAGAPVPQAAVVATQPAAAARQPAMAPAQSTAMQPAQPWQSDPRGDVASVPVRSSMAPQTAPPWSRASTQSDVAADAASVPLQNRAAAFLGGEAATNNAAMEKNAMLPSWAQGAPSTRSPQAAAWPAETGRAGSTPDASTTANTAAWSGGAQPAQASGPTESANPGPLAVRPKPQIQLPPGCPPVALEGYCPVQLVEQRKWTAGDARYGVIHRGRTYLFASAEQKRKFFADPDRYSPVLGGDDPVLALDHGQAVDGRREYGVVYDQQIYLFSSKDSFARFNQQPDRYAADLRKLMR